MATVTVLQPWLPQYRVPFFEQLTERLAGAGVELTVAHGSPPRSHLSRRDARQEGWAVQVPTYSIGHGRSLVWHGTRGLVTGRDLIVLEQAIRNVEAYPLILRGHFMSPRVAFWGHGRTYNKHHSGPEIRAKQLLTNQAHWFFAYTQGGSDYVTGHGFPHDRVTVVQNAIDTEVLQARTMGVTDGDRIELRKRLGIPVARFALYIGGLYESKRLSFLIESAGRVAERDRTFALVIAGSGELTEMVEAEAIGRPWLNYVGPVFGDDKAVLASMADSILMPGSIGLAVVDAFATRSPVITTGWPYHGPEFEYLLHGVNGWITPDDVDAFADGIWSVWNDGALRDHLAAGCDVAASRITLNAMVTNFADGVLHALERGRG